MIWLILANHYVSVGLVLAGVALAISDHIERVSAGRTFLFILLWPFFTVVFAVAATVGMGRKRK